MLIYNGLTFPIPFREGVRGVGRDVRKGVPIFFEGYDQSIARCCKCPIFLNTFASECVSYVGAHSSIFLDARVTDPLLAPPLLLAGEGVGG